MLNVEGTMTTKSIASTQVQNHFGQILDDVIQNGTRYIIKRRGVPQVIFLGLSDFVRLLADEGERAKIENMIRELQPVYDLGETVVE
jgi:PHD/YefM family antitoxin component YafN of YafNO toxin-antitoxin module